MLSPFDQLIGAAGDVKELEYISALHQTDMDNVRTNASIRAEDIRLFLKSRHGVSIPEEEEVKERIVSGLGGGSNQNGTVDLMEVVALLLIPTLIKAAIDVREDQEVKKERSKSFHKKERTLDEIDEEYDDDDDDEKYEPVMLDGMVKAPHDLIETVLNVMLFDATGDVEAKELTPVLIEQILVSYGELGLAADDDLLQEMVDAATGSQEEGKILSVESFAEALTKDVRQYDVGNEVRPCTNFEASRGDMDRGSCYTTISISRRSLSDSAQEVFNSSTTNPKGSPMREEIHQVATLSSIDVTAATYRSRHLTIAVWCTVMITFFSYYREIENSVNDDCSALYNYTYSQERPWQENKEGIQCQIFASILNWSFMFFTLSVFGVVSGLLGNIGNSTKANGAWKPLVGFTFVLLVVTVPFVLLREYENENVQQQVLHKVSLALGILTCGMHLRNFLTAIMTPSLIAYTQKHIPKAQGLLLASSTMADMHLRHAASNKLATMVDNALELINMDEERHGRKSIYGQALENFHDSGWKYKRTGGFWWSWRSVFDKNLNLLKEGIWTPERMIAGNVAQFVVVFYILAAFLMLLKTASDSYDNDPISAAFLEKVENLLDMQVSATNEAVATLVTNVSSLVGSFMPIMEASGMIFGCTNSSDAEEILLTYCMENESEEIICDPNAPVNYLCPFLYPSMRERLGIMPSQALLQGAGFDANALLQVALDATQHALDNSISTLYPAQKYMVTLPLLIATIISVCLSLYLAMTYIPSVNTTILKLRCGQIPTLQDRNFRKYLSKPEEVTYLTATLFWGALVSSVVFGGLVGLVLFFYLWQATAYFAQRLTAFFAGIAFVTAFRIALEKLFFTCSFYKSFYRERPALANLSVLLLEFGNFAVSVGFVFARLMKFLGAASLYAGRIDTDFLADDINKFGPFEIDLYPRMHLQGILSQEAHRHPYIEQLGILYLMKLRHGDAFGNRANSCWRLLFVYALMPWLHRYRFATRQEEMIDDTLGNFPVRRLSISLGDFDESLGLGSFGRGSSHGNSLSVPTTHSRSRDEDMRRRLSSKDGSLMRRRGSQVTNTSGLSFSLHSTNRSVLSTGEVLRLRDSTMGLLNHHVSRASLFRLRTDMSEGWIDNNRSLRSFPKAVEAEKTAKKRITELEEEVERLKAVEEELKRLKASLAQESEPKAAPIPELQPIREHQHTKAAGTSDAQSSRTPSEHSKVPIHAARPVEHPDFSNAFSV